MTEAREALRAAWKGSDEEFGRACRAHLPKFFTEFDAMKKRLDDLDNFMSSPAEIPAALERSETWDERPIGKRPRWAKRKEPA